MSKEEFVTYENSSIIGFLKFKGEIHQVNFHSFENQWTDEVVFDFEDSPKIKFYCKDGEFFMNLTGEEITVPTVEKVSVKYLENYYLSENRHTFILRDTHKEQIGFISVPKLKVVSQ